MLNHEHDWDDFPDAVDSSGGNSTTARGNSSNSHKRKYRNGDDTTAANISSLDSPPFSPFDGTGSDSPPQSPSQPLLFSLTPCSSAILPMSPLKPDEFVGSSSSGSSSSSTSGTTNRRRSNRSHSDSPFLDSPARGRESEASLFLSSTPPPTPPHPYHASDIFLSLSPNPSPAHKTRSQSHSNSSNTPNKNTSSSRQQPSPYSTRSSSRNGRSPAPLSFDDPHELQSSNRFLASKLRPAAPPSRPSSASHFPHQRPGSALSSSSIPSFPMAQDEDSMQSLISTVSTDTDRSSSMSLSPAFNNHHNTGSHLLRSNSSPHVSFAPSSAVQSRRVIASSSTNDDPLALDPTAASRRSRRPSARTEKAAAAAATSAAMAVIENEEREEVAAVMSGKTAAGGKAGSRIAGKGPKNGLPLPASAPVPSNGGSGSRSKRPRIKSTFVEPLPPPPPSSLSGTNATPKKSGIVLNMKQQVSPGVTAIAGVGISPSKMVSLFTGSAGVRPTTLKSSDQTSISPLKPGVPLPSAADSPIHNNIHLLPRQQPSNDNALPLTPPGSGSLSPTSDDFEVERIGQSPLHLNNTNSNPYHTLPSSVRSSCSSSSTGSTSSSSSSVSVRSSGRSLSLMSGLQGGRVSGSFSIQSGRIKPGSNTHTPTATSSTTITSKGVGTPAPATVATPPAAGGGFSVPAPPTVAMAVAPPLGVGSIGPIATPPHHLSALISSSNQSLLRTATPSPLLSVHNNGNHHAHHNGNNNDDDHDDDGDGDDHHDFAFNPAMSPLPAVSSPVPPAPSPSPQPPPASPSQFMAAEEEETENLLAAVDEESGGLSMLCLPLGTTPRSSGSADPSDYAQPLSPFPVVSPAPQSQQWEPQAQPSDPPTDSVTVARSNGRVSGSAVVPVAGARASRHKLSVPAAPAAPPSGSGVQVTSWSLAGVRKVTGPNVTSRTGTAPPQPPQQRSYPSA